MTSTFSIVIVLSYFLLLIGISWFTSRNATSESFLTGDKSSPWYLVAFGMIGASLSGVTFISIPGSVANNGMTYMSVVIGYFIGYLIISKVLLPLYYKLNLTSIYSYLKTRFGNSSYKTGATFFIISRIIGASFRLYLVAEVLDVFIFQNIDGLEYWHGIVIIVGLIWVYTFKGGIKTIIWTDTLQTASMLIAVGVTIYFIRQKLGVDWSGLYDTFENSSYSEIVHWKNHGWGNFALGVINGIFITVVMTGLDQDMMQKNLTCKNVKDAQKNMFWFSVVLVPINFLFLGLGILLYEFAINQDFLYTSIGEGGKTIVHLSNALGSDYQAIKMDRLFPMLASGNFFPPSLGVVFLVGLIAAAYSSADSALTSLTTSFCVDILEDEKNITKRRVTHVGVSLVLIVVVLLFKEIDNDNVITELFTWAGYTYGPLLGLFAFGLITSFKVKDKWVPLVAILAPIISVLLRENSQELFNGYKIGFEILPINGTLTFIGLFLLRTKSQSENQDS